MGGGAQQGVHVDAPDPPGNEEKGKQNPFPIQLFAIYHNYLLLSLNRFNFLTKSYP